MNRYRRVYTDSRGHRATSGYVVVTTNHPAASANGPAVRQRFELDSGTLTVSGLPPNTYLLHAELTGYDGEKWWQDDVVTL
jgi:hypothetical protein